MKRYSFTLIEMIIVIIITAILGSIGIPLSIKLIDSFQFSTKRKDLSESAEVALRRMDREIRRLKDITSITTASSSTYAFTDIDNNSIQYTMSSNILQRTLNGTTDPLADNIIGLTFTYYDDIGNTTTTLTKIRLIQIDVTFSKGANTINYRILVKPLRIKHFSDLFA